MAQHDFNIANQTFPNFRSDLNDALQAAGTISAGSSAPTTTYAYQLWFDTSANTYKIRNSANSAWLSLFGTDLTNDGLSGLDLNGTELILDADADTSITADTDDQIDFKVGGTDRVTVTGGGTTFQCAAGDSNQALVAYHPTSTSARTIAKFQSNIGGTQTDKVVIKCNGNVGIGTTSPNNTLEIKSTTNADGIRLSNNVGSYYHLVRSNGDGLLFDADAGNTGGGGVDIRFQIKGSEKARLNASGKVGIGTTSISSTLEIVPPDINSIIETHSFNTSAQNHMQMRNNSGTEVGSIYVTTTSTAYNTSSDYRLKENVVADWDATTRLKQLNPVRFNFIADADTTVDGFLAHEVQDIVPEAISGEKDAMKDEEYVVSAATGDIYTPATDDADEVIHSTDAEKPEELAEGQQWRETTAAEMGTRSVPDYQGIDQSKLVPLLVKTIQELEARITALETA